VGEEVVNLGERGRWLDVGLEWIGLRMDWIENGREYKREDGVCKLMSKGREEWEGVSMDNRWGGCHGFCGDSWHN